MTFVIVSFFRSQHGEDKDRAIMLMTKDYLKEKYMRGSWEKFEQVLAKVLNLEPEDYDKL
ncbi:MAG: hypothetical protein ACRC11_13635 [Xenococcaceae cyanobacterium]